MSQHAEAVDLRAFVHNRARPGLLGPERLPQFEWRSKVSTWLHTVVSNNTMDTYRSLKRRSARIGVDDQLAARPPPSSCVTSHSSATPRPPSS